MKRILEHIIPPKLGYGLVVRQGQTLRIMDMEGKQVVDMALFNADNPREKLSTSNSRTRYLPKVLVPEGALSSPVAAMESTASTTSSAVAVVSPPSQRRARPFASAMRAGSSPRLATKVSKMGLRKRVSGSSLG